MNFTGRGLFCSVAWIGESLVSVSMVMGRLAALLISVCQAYSCSSGSKQSHVVNLGLGVCLTDFVTITLTSSLYPHPIGDHLSTGQRGRVASKHVAGGVARQGMAH